MERRDFIKVTATSAVAASATSVCIPALSAGQPAHTAGSSTSPIPDMTEYTARFDAGMARIGEWSLTSEYPDFTAGDREATDSLARVALQALYVTGMLSDLPVEAQADPVFQSRIQAAVPTMDEAADRMTAFLQSRTEAELAHVHEVLRNTDAGSRIARALDHEAGLCSVSDSRRVHFSRMLDEVQWRMSHQPPALLVDEYLDKTSRLLASNVDAEARKQWLNARVGPLLLATADSGKKSLRAKRTSRGLILMGIGVVVFGAGALIASGGNLSGAFAGTVGATLLLIGLITLIVAAGTPSDAKAK